MAYPVTALPAVVEIAPGASLGADPGTWPWVDVTADWRQSAGITITEGRGDWGQYVDPGSIALTFDNTAGHYSQHNPAGQWYGKLGRDTPLRVRLRRGSDSFGRTVAGGVGVADSGQTYTTAGGVSGDYSVIPGAARQSVAAVNASRMCLLSVDLVDVTVEGTVTVPVTASGAVILAGLVARWQDANNLLMAELRLEPTNAVALQIRKVVNGVFTTVVAATTIPGLTHTAGAAYRLEIRCVGEQLQARAWAAAGARPAVWHVQGSDTSHAGRAGRAGFRSQLATGNTNTLPVVFSWSEFAVIVDLAGGYVPAWVPRWGDKAAADRFVSVTARGALYRLQPGSGQPRKRSAASRSLPYSGAIAYWPCEDGANAGQVASGLPNGNPATITGTPNFLTVEAAKAITWEIRYGFPSALDLSAGQTISGAVTGCPASAWTVSVMGQVDPFVMSADTVALQWLTPGGTFEKWEIRYTKADTRSQVTGYNAAGAPTVIVDMNGISTGLTQHYVAAKQVGANIQIEYGGFETVYTVAGTLAPVTSVVVNPTKTTSTLPATFGQLAVFPTGEPTPPFLTIYQDTGAYSSPFGAFKEPATVRLARLAAEDGMALDVPAVALLDQQLMDFQPVEAALPLYRQCEETDGGVLYERPFGLAYQPRTARYNQPVTLTLDNGAGDLANPPEPDADGQGYRNRWTVKRIEASEATVETPGATAGTDLVYSESVDVSVRTDAMALPQAYWRLHLTSGNALRWPRLELNLAARPALIDAWLNSRVGSRVRLLNPPADVAGQLVDVLVEGHETRLGYKDWDVVINCSPAAPWDVATVDGTQRVAADGSTLAAPITATATTFQLASTAANGTWTTDPTDFPLDVRVGGEQLRLSSITGTSSPQTAAIAARGLNGIQLPWPAGAEVDVWAPAIAPL